MEKDLRTIPAWGKASLQRQPGAQRDCRAPDFCAPPTGRDQRAIGETLRIATWATTTGLPKLNLASRQVPIVVKLPDGARQDLALLGRLTVPGGKGAGAAGRGGHAGVQRRPGRGRPPEPRAQRQPSRWSSPAAAGRRDAEAVAALPSLKNLPPGVRQVTVGDAEVMGELFASFGLAMLTGVLCIYIVLVLLFKDFLHPVHHPGGAAAVAGGAFVGLLIAQRAFHALAHRAHHA